MSIPKVKFKLRNPDSEKFVINHFTQSNWSYYIYKKHPILKSLLKGIKEKGKRIKIIEEYFKKYYKEHEKEFKKSIKNYQKEWNKINNKILKEFERSLETKWDIKEITAHISANPICPRFLDDFSFSIYFKKKKRETMLTIAHECLHFLYFKKFKEVFPKISKQKYNSPHLEWVLSEVLTKPLLNRKEIQKHIRLKELSYPEFYNQKIKGESLPNYFSDLYLESMKNDESFEEFLKKAYNEAKKYKNKMKR